MWPQLLPIAPHALLGSPGLPSVPAVKRALVGEEGGWTAKARVLMGAEGGAQPVLLAAGQGQGQRVKSGLQMALGLVAPWCPFTPCTGDVPSYSRTPRSCRLRCGQGQVGQL